jgi:hypothetical protein
MMFLLEETIGTKSFRIVVRHNRRKRLIQLRQVNLGKVDKTPNDNASNNIKAKKKEEIKQNRKYFCQIIRIGFS